VSHLKNTFSKTNPNLTIPGENAYMAVVENSGLPMIIGNPEGNIVFSNEAASSLFDCTAEELANSNRDDLFSSLSQSFPAQEIFQDQFLRLHMMGRKKSGDIFPCEVILSKYFWGDGNLYFSYVILDVSQKNSSSPDETDYSGILGLLLRNTAEAFMMVDRNLNCIMFNDMAVERIRKISGRDLHLNTAVPELSRPDRVDVVRATLLSALEGNTEERQTNFFDGPDEVVLNITYKPARNEKGDVVAVIMTSTDVTEKKLAEDKLKESEKHYRFLFENNPQPAWVYDLETLRFVQVNQAAINCYGYSAEEFMSMTIADIRPADEIPMLQNEIAKNIDHNDPKGRTWKHFKRNGQLMEVEIHSTGFDYNGRKARLVMINDVTAKMEAEISLKKSNERYRLATRASFDAIWDADVINDTINWGEGFETLFGYEVGEERVPGSTWTDHIHPDDKPRVLDKYYATIHDDQQMMWRDEYRYFRADGSISFVIDRCVIIRDEEGRPVRVVGAMQDITDLKLKEQELIVINDRFRLATKATSDIIWDWDIENNTISWAENFTTLLGHPLPANSTLPLEFCVEHFHPDDRERVHKSLVDAIKNRFKNTWDDEFRYRRADGSYAAVIDKGYILRDADGTALRMIGAMHDNSDEKYNQDLLALELKIFETGSTPGIPFHEVVDSLLKRIEGIHNDMKCSVLLLNEDKTIRTLSAPSLPTAYVQLIDGLPIGQQSGSCGTAMWRKEPVIVSDIDTDPLWSPYRQAAMQFGLKACWSVPIIHSNGTVMGSFAIYYNHIKLPTEKEWTTILRIRNLIKLLLENYLSFEQLRQSNERFDIVTKATHDLIWDWNLETNELYRDPKGLAKVYGYSSNDPIRHIHDWLEQIHPEDIQNVQDGLVRILNACEENVFDLEYRFRRQDGHYAYIYDRGYILRNSEGKAYRMIGAAQDITERKKLEQELLNQELSKQKAISQATINTQERERSEIGKELHDNVNQVLTTTKLYLDLAATNPELKDELISKSSKNIINAISEIRLLSRSLMLPSLGDLGLIDSIQDLVEDVNATKKISAVFIHEDFDESGLSENQKLMMFRIVQEALNNIIRHAEATESFIKMSKIEDQIRLSIKDDGKGFNPSTVKKGAGLNNIRNRVYLSNGNLSIHSHPGLGSTLVIDLPFVTH
jgi:PAS domain S-box-containing protein